MFRRFTDSYEECIALRDGSAVRLRRLRPEDAELLRDGFTRLSQASRYARFLAPKPRLTEDELRYLTSVDEENHVAIGALRQADARGVGIARFIRTAEDRADAAITVADEAQSLGLGRVLFERLCRAASERAVRVFECDVLASNVRMQHLLGELGALERVTHESGVLRYELRIPEAA